MLRFGVVAVCLVACGSPDSNVLTQTGTKGATGGSMIQGSGGVPPFGMGGTIGGSGTFPVGAGGIVATGGVLGAGGILLGAGGIPFGTGGAVPDSGAPTASGGAGLGSGGIAGTGGTMIDPFPAGGLISQACSDCARANCREQEAACVAEPACAAIGQCLSTCILLTCAACLPTLSSQSGYAKFTAVSNCTDLLCQPACPRINGGTGTNP